MALMTISCPYCGLTQETSNARIPTGPFKVNCPRCRYRFAARCDDLTAHQVVIASADALASTPPKKIFYKLVSHRVTPREFWWGCKNNPLLFLPAMLIKFLRIAIPGSADDPNVATLSPFAIDEVQLPDEVADQMRPFIAEMQALGFEAPLFHLIDDSMHATRTCLATLRHRDGLALGRIHLRIWSSSSPAKIHLYPEYLTPFQDGSFLWSLASHPDLAAPPSCRINRQKAATPAALWGLHRQAMTGSQTQAIALGDNQRLVMDRHHAVVRDFHCQRGVFAPLSPQEQDEIALATERIAANKSRGVRHAEVLEEIERLQNPKTSWKSAITIFVVSAALFVGLGASQWSWEFLLILMAVLLVHELGHYLAMKQFSYRNLRMFFIPLLGAAVSGQSYNVPVWKKVVVSLMGPVPGIVLGAVIGAIAVKLQSPMLLSAAMLTVSINAFNLIPVLPLDGGWVTHSLLFSRHYLLDTGFRLLAALALLGVGFLTSDTFLKIPGFFMLFTLGQSHNKARIAFKLRKSDFCAVSEDQRSIPVEQAERIIDEIKKAFPARANNKVIAMHALNVYEALNARHPGWLATLGLIGLYVGSLVLAVVVIVALMSFGLTSDGAM